MRIILVFFLLLFVGSSLQDFRYCPDNWETYNLRCYRFVFYPHLDYDGAKTACGAVGASLLSVNDVSEHNFISQWLITRDVGANRWFTSGMIYTLGTDMQWKGDGSQIRQDTQFWLSEAERIKTGMHIVYVYGVIEYRWGRDLTSTQLPYICEISQNEAYKIAQDERDFAYGTNLSDASLAPRGPHFLIHPRSLIVVGDATSASFECVAVGLPDPVYKIEHRITTNSSVRVVTSLLDDRYTVTNGKLTIQNPVEDLDAGTYQCVVENEFGRIIGNEMQLTFGSLGEFSNVERAPVNALSHDSAVINCVPPVYKPAVSYQWWKESTGSFIRTELAKYIFISRNGKLYFSVVAKEDEDSYRCVVKLTANNGAAIGTEQPPSRTSLPIALIVGQQVESVWGPEFSNDFIAVFPPVPMRGQTIYMECLAYGTMPIEYLWTRDGLPIPTRATFLDFNRILMIENVQIEDSGTYNCHAARGHSTRAQKSFTLHIEGKPFFSFPLKDQHVDIGSQVTWRCEAKSLPAAEYTWYKDGAPLQVVPGEISINRNVLIINDLNPARHNGMYQCLAANTHGYSFTEGQLRVLAFKPSFRKNPLEPSIYGAINGNVTIMCKPEAAPFPEFKWFKNGVDMGLSHGNTASNPQLLQNGFLHFTNIRPTDEGIYTCRVTNEYGTDSSSTQLTTTSNTAIYIRPREVTEVYINNTAFITCSASVSANIDYAYTWIFNGNEIKIDQTTISHYALGVSENIGGLYIRQAQYRHSGTYECVVETTLDSTRASGNLIVNGPPGPPAMVYADANTVTAISMRLKWTPGSIHGSPILYYTIEGKTERATEWTVLIPFITDQSTIIGPSTDKRSTLVTGLRSGVGYMFRVTASNALGIGEKSYPSDVYQTLSSIPFKAPDNVGGGGGMVGDLTITWTPLDVDDWGGSEVKYNVYWRLLGTNAVWKQELVTSSSTGKSVLQVGQDNYYTQYEVQVQATNENGDGPMSPVAVVYSAEEIPIAVAENIQTDRYNSTAVTVFWDPVPNTREAMKGILLGYQVNYFERCMTEEPCDPIINSISWRTDEPSGLVIGLLPLTWYTFDVQVLNTAGMGPISEKQHQQTYRNAPLLYPTEVNVHSDGPNSVLVKWRGVSTGRDEEPLLGYKIRYWLNGDDIRAADDLVVDKVDNARIYGIEKDNLYKLRVLGYSRGGDGNLGETVYFTLGGTVSVDPSVSEILAGAGRLSSSAIVPSLLSLVVIKFFLHILN